LNGTSWPVTDVAADATAAAVGEVGEFTAWPLHPIVKTHRLAKTVLIGTLLEFLNLRAVTVEVLRNTAKDP